MVSAVRRWRWALLCGAIVAAWPMARQAAFAAPSGGGVYVLQPSRPLAGGGASTGGLYRLQGAIAQHDASAASIGGAYAVHGGIRRARAAPASALFSDGFE